MGHVFDDVSKSEGGRGEEGVEDIGGTNTRDFTKFVWYASIEARFLDLSNSFQRVCDVKKSLTHSSSNRFQEARDYLFGLLTEPEPCTSLCLRVRIISRFQLPKRKRKATNFREEFQQKTGFVANNRHIRKEEIIDGF